MPIELAKLSRVSVRTVSHRTRGGAIVRPYIQKIADAINLTRDKRGMPPLKYDDVFP
jgi:hypothetical protein